MSIRIAHLTEKLKGNARKINIDDADMRPVYDIYGGLRNNASNYLPNPNEQFVIHSDASEKGIGQFYLKGKES